MSKKILFSSESVTEGHPDKICDCISDAVLDAVIEKDPEARVACETAVTTGLVLVMGEITTKAYVEIPDIVRSTIKEIGYDNSVYGFDYKSCSVITSIDKQSEDIALGVDKAKDKENCENLYSQCEGYCNDNPAEGSILGAGDQGMMFGYACQETEDYMPMPIYLAHKLTKKLTKLRKSRGIDYLGPDGKAIVTVEYQNNIPVRIDNIGVSIQHLPEVDRGTLVSDIVNKVIIPEIPKELIDNATRFMVNPTGRFVKGGPCADSGLTGRKIIVDTYGGFGRHGGGAFSGKDPTKVDRTGAYAARYIAKNIVAAGLAERCEVQIAYIIGVANPVSLHIDTFGTGKIHSNKIVKIVKSIFDLRPSALIDNFMLKRPIYKALSSYGHFGRPELNLPWEQLDKVDEIKAKASTLA
ncbi:methionine adenosyltransferase [Alkaliphilus peptidifermentans]|uniref:S-adenosylmethionine synthase n=1 Tax=Alkaliphilus peptidifermentans DSM 18978 TaxID=1120976 RepID=A0A1G5I307_9FIRM|nr:methionine adenosyltransferase [Alkaliphilus peptidifermentans]SCY70254.1 methionine adenosyltransferase [Alkaliphilus peptidifermentans DSM 18978]